MQNVDDIYQKYARTVYKYLLSKTRDEDIAEELVQETFYQAIKSINRFDGSCKVSTWLCAIAKNQLLAYWRKNPKQSSIDNPDENINSNALEIDSAESSVLDSLNKIELLKKLHSSPEPYREILYLRIFGDLSFREIGEIMGKTETWARVNFYRGKEKLRKEMDEYEE